VDAPGTQESATAIKREDKCARPEEFDSRPSSEEPPDRERERDTYLSAGSTWILPSTAATTTTTRGAYLYDEVRSVGRASYTNLSAFENSESSTEAANFSSSHTIAITQLDLNPPTHEPLDILSPPHTQQKSQSTHTEETSFSSCSISNKEYSHCKPLSWSHRHHSHTLPSFLPSKFTHFLQAHCSSSKNLLQLIQKLRDDESQWNDQLP
jgi:hypothetical protein